MNITYGIASSPFGYCIIGLTDKQICHLSFIDTNNTKKAEEQIHTTWPTAKLVRDDAALKPYFTHIFSTRTKKQSVPLFFRGTDFQKKVWQALLEIPPGKTATYADIARAVGSPKATRAVGAACGKNPIGFIIPCHRVLASSGAIGGYHWGVERKEEMLAWEAARRESVIA